MLLCPPFRSQNIIKKVSGQKFVYKFVSQPEASVSEGARSDEEVLRREGADPGGRAKAPGALASACPSKSLAQVRPFAHVRLREDVVIYGRSASVPILSARRSPRPRKAPATTT